jgi:hypothetical protein
VAYTVELKPAAVRDLQAIPERDRKRIKIRTTPWPRTHARTASRPFREEKATCAFE